jgi:hypothetical protein
MTEARLGQPAAILSPIKPPITGYRELSSDELALINQVKAHAEMTRDLVNRIEQFCIARDEEPLPEGHAPHSSVTAPMRWASIARTDLQTGYMALVRAVAAPTTF